MKLNINGQPEEMDEVRTMADLLRRIEIDPELPGFAVARNGQVVPRGELARTTVAEGDRIEVVRAVQGG